MEAEAGSSQENILEGLKVVFSRPSEERPKEKTYWWGAKAGIRQDTGGQLRPVFSVFPFLRPVYLYKHPHCIIKVNI